MRHPSGAVGKVLESKVNFSDLPQILAVKSNKADTEMALRQIEIVHKQLQQLVVLVVQKLRQSIDQNLNETQHSKTNKKVNLLHNALLIADWINNFDTHKVDDCFDMKQMQPPQNLHPFEDQIKKDIKKIRNMNLSPNNTSLNTFVKNASLSILDRAKQSRKPKQRNLHKLAQSVSFTTRDPILSPREPSLDPSPNKFA